jgi:16S rRNA (guanine966-N2)-methyltransferase
MRIIGGTASGIVLKAPTGLGVRPTPDKVRQAIFNSLGERVRDATALELFGGTGALSLESLSRGAKHAVCIEKSPKHVSFIRRNLKVTNLDETAYELRTGDVFTLIPRFAKEGRTFDLILADPPFGDKNIDIRSTSMAQGLLDNEDLLNILAPDGLFILGHATRDSLSIPIGWHERKSLRHGDSTIRFLEKQNHAD